MAWFGLQESKKILGQIVRWWVFFLGRSVFYFIQIFMFQAFLENRFLFSMPTQERTDFPLAVLIKKVF